jgi:hypothetical protein
VARSWLTPSIRKVLIGLSVAVAVAYLGVGALVWHSMNQSPEYFGAVMRKMPQPAVFLFFPFEALWMRARAGALEVGDPAPDFTLETVEKNSKVQLSALTRQGPAVLVFGSYT